MRVCMRARRTARHEMGEHSDAKLTELMPGEAHRAPLGCGLIRNPTDNFTLFRELSPLSPGSNSS
jgi:hypothetical protein